MTEQVTVQWCPSCKSWSQVSLINRHITIRSIEVDGPEPVECAMSHATHRCAGCSEHIVKVRPVSPGRTLAWASLQEFRTLIAHALEPVQTAPT